MTVEENTIEPEMDDEVSPSPRRTTQKESDLNLNAYVLKRNK